MTIKNRLLYSVITILVLLLVAAGYYLVKGGKVTNPLQTQTNPFSTTNIILSATQANVSKGSNSGSFDVYQVMTDGSNKKLTSSDDANFKGGTNATLSPDGQKIAYVGVNSATGSQIIEMNLDGSGKTAVSKVLGFKFMPSWSKDGKMILYQNAGADGKPVIMQLTLANGTEMVAVNGYANISNPSWLPDGSGFIFLQSPDNKAQHLMLHQNGKDSEVMVKNGDAQVTDFLTPAMSPDGKSVAFIRASDNQVYTVSLDGKNVKLLSRATHSIFGCVNWSPDNKYLVAAEYDRGDNKSYVSKVDTSNVNVTRWVESGFSSINCPRVARY